MFDRAHLIETTIPKNEIKHAIDNTVFGGKVNIFVSSEWLNNLYLRYNCIFAWIDAINFSEALKSQSITNENLIALRTAIDDVSKKYPYVSFISFADTILLKSNWTIQKKIEYKPELFLEIFDEIKKLYRMHLKLDIYAILTQGTNEYYSSNLLHISKSKNHICLNSLGTPFAQILEIEKSVKTNKEKFELYLTSDYFSSIKFKYDFYKAEHTRKTYVSKIADRESVYYCFSYENLISNLRDE